MHAVNDIRNKFSILILTEIKSRGFSAVSAMMRTFSKSEMRTIFRRSSEVEMRTIIRPLSAFRDKRFSPI